MCKQFNDEGFCLYGIRCLFNHNVKGNSSLRLLKEAYIHSYKNNLNTYSFSINPENKVVDKEYFLIYFRKRLRIFRNILQD